MRLIVPSRNLECFNSIFKAQLPGKISTLPKFASFGQNLAQGVLEINSFSNNDDGVYTIEVSETDIFTQKSALNIFKVTLFRNETLFDGF